MRTPLPPAAARSASHQAATLRRMRIEMGTTLVIEARADSHERAAAALTAAFAAASEVATLLNPHGPGSDLARIAAAPAGSCVPISAAALTVLRFAQRLNKVSDGVFDPCLPGGGGRITDLELRDTDGAPAACVRVPLAIDCGGIAKGYAVDVAIAALARGGCSAGLVNAGGDVRVFGARSEPVHVRGPDNSWRSVALADAALAVSEWARPGVPSGHRGYYLRTGAAVLPVRRFAAVRAADCMTADALTKCLLLARAAVSAALLEEFHATSL
jgi:thiamine biosynthesis lipoprotein